MVDGVAKLSAVIEVDGIEMETGEVVGSVEMLGDTSEIRVPLERAFGWKSARCERALEDART